MSKSTSPHRGGMFRRARAGAVTVIEAKVHNAAAQRAKFAFILTWLIVGLLSAAVVSASSDNLAWAIFLGTAVGLPFAMVAWALTRVWPIVQRIWWWLPEIVLSVVTGFLLSRGVTTIGSTWTLIILTAFVAVPMSVGPVRRPIVALVWCQVLRHRVRMAFADFIKSNQHGTLPFIFLARPTPAGTRIWVHLRPGLSKEDVDRWLPKLAAACWSDSVLAERASAVNSAFLRLDIKRRDVLRDKVPNPLMRLIDRAIPRTPKQKATPPTALNLADITDDVIASTHVYKPESVRRAPANTASTNGSGTTAAPTGGSDDMSDWV